MKLPSDILKNILSDYIEYDQLLILIDSGIPLYINPQRIQRYTNYYKNVEGVEIDTYIDSDLRKVENYLDNGQKEAENNYKDGKFEGYQYKWYANGILSHKIYRINGKKEGKIYFWYDNGEKMSEEKFKDNKLDGIQYYWNLNGEEIVKYYIN